MDVCKYFKKQEIFVPYRKVMLTLVPSVATQSKTRNREKVPKSLWV